MQTTALSRSLLRLACAGALAVTLTPALAAKGKTVEFKAGLTISESFIGSSGTCALIFAVTGTGYATSLGPVTFTSTDCVNFGADGTLIFSSLTPATLTVTGGDSLTGTYTGTATPQPAPIMGISGKLMFTGGDGEYSNASGSATIEGVEVITLTPQPSGTGALFIKGSFTVPK